MSDKRKRSRSSSTSSDSSDCDKKKRKLKKLKKKAKKKLKKEAKKKFKKEYKLEKKRIKEEKERKKKEMKSPDTASQRNLPALEEASAIQELTASKARAPMTKEEWEKQRSVVRRVYDEESGRYRLIKGGGEVLEECVSRERHLAINKQATQGDGRFFQAAMSSKLHHS